MANGHWEDDWTNTKDAFTDISGDKKKPEAVTFFKLFSTKRSGVAKSLKKVDEAHKEYAAAVIEFQIKRDVKEDRVHKALNEFGRAVKDAKSSIADYNDVLNKEIGKVSEKEDKDKRYRALKMMSRSLDAIVAEIELEQQNLLARFQLGQEMKTAQTEGKGNLSSDEANKIVTDPLIKKSLLAGCARMLSLIAECKGLLQKDPTAVSSHIEHYNSKVQQAAKGMAEPLVNADKRLGLDLPKEVREALKDCADRRESNYAFGVRSSLQDFVKELKIVSGHAKAAAEWGKNL